MLLAASVFILAFIYFYPLTLRFIYVDKKAQLQWLPRLCGGFAAPRRLVWRQGKGGPKELLPIARNWLSPRRLRAMLPLLRWLARRVCLKRIYWRLQIGFSANVECILSIRCGDIIGGIIYGWWLYKKGGKEHV